MTGDDRRRISVPMGEMAVVSPPDVLEIRGLGSCIALSLHDPVRRLSGLAHTVIPRRLPRPLPGPAWATTEAPRALLARLVEEGADPRRVVARVAGGAALFTATARTFQVGLENARAVEQALAELGIPVLFRDVGGSTSRAVVADPATGDLLVVSRTPFRRRAPEPPAAAEPGRGVETARTLLHRAIAPLATLIREPVVFDDPSAYALRYDEIEEFLGGGEACLTWAFMAVGGLGAPAGIGLLLPEAHAEPLATAAADLSETPATPEEILQELGNLALAHVTTALARLLGTRLLPTLPVLGEGRVDDALAEARRVLGRQEPVAVLHARAYAEGVFAGAEVALVATPTLLPAGTLDAGIEARKP